MAYSSQVDLSVSMPLPVHKAMDVFGATLALAASRAVYAMWLTGGGTTAAEMDNILEEAGSAEDHFGFAAAMAGEILELSSIVATAAAMEAALSSHRVFSLQWQAFMSCMIALLRGDFPYLITPPASGGNALPSELTTSWTATMYDGVALTARHPLCQSLSSRPIAGIGMSNLDWSDVFNPQWDASSSPTVSFAWIIESAGMVWNQATGAEAEIPRPTKNYLSLPGGMPFPWYETASLARGVRPLLALKDQGGNNPAILSIHHDCWRHRYPRHAVEAMRSALRLFEEYNHGLWCEDGIYAYFKQVVRSASCIFEIRDGQSITPGATSIAVTLDDLEAAPEVSERNGPPVSAPSLSRSADLGANVTVDWESGNLGTFTLSNGGTVLDIQTGWIDDWIMRHLHDNTVPSFASFASRLRSTIALFGNLTLGGYVYKSLMETRAVDIYTESDAMADGASTWGCRTSLGISGRMRDAIDSIGCLAALRVNMQNMGHSAQQSKVHWAASSAGSENAVAAQIWGEVCSKILAMAGSGSIESIPNGNVSKPTLEVSLAADFPLGDVYYPLSTGGNITTVVLNGTSYTHWGDYQGAPFSFTLLSQNGVPITTDGTYPLSYSGQAACDIDELEDEDYDRWGSETCTYDGSVPASGFLVKFKPRRII